MKKTEYSFRLDGDTLYATANGWTDSYTPDKDTDTSLEHHRGKEISQEEAEKILQDYGWAICPVCGVIYPSLGDCPYCR